MKHRQTVPRVPRCQALVMRRLIQNLLANGVRVPGAVQKVVRLHRLMRRFSVRLDHLWECLDHSLGPRHYQPPLRRQFGKPRRLGRKRNHGRRR